MVKTGTVSRYELRKFLLRNRETRSSTINKLLVHLYNSEIGLALIPHKNVPLATVFPSIAVFVYNLFSLHFLHCDSPITLGKTTKER